MGQEHSVHQACRSGNIDEVKRYIREGADFNSAIEFGLTPLSYACSKGHLDVVKALVQKGHVDVNQTSFFISNETFPMLVAWETNGHRNKPGVSSASEELVEKRDGVTPLHFACRYRRTEVVKYLLSEGAEVHKPDRSGATPFFTACEHGFTDVITALLGNGDKTDLDRPRVDGVTPLYAACEKGHIETVHLLLQHHADANINCADGSTPLIIAQRKGHTEIESMLHTYFSSGTPPTLPSNTKGVTQNEDSDTVTVDTEQPIDARSVCVITMEEWTPIEDIKVTEVETNQGK